MTSTSGASATEPDRRGLPDVLYHTRMISSCVSGAIVAEHCVIELAHHAFSQVLTFGHLEPYADLCRRQRIGL